MHRFASDIRIWMVLSAGVLIILTGQRGETTRVRAEVAATPTPYHAGIPSPVASPHAMDPVRYPRPGAEDRASADAMAAGATAMLRMAQFMDEAASLLLTANDAQLVDLGRHWVLDAQALRQQAAWMVLLATASTMIHDPATAHEINTWNLKGNGVAMAAEGTAMTEHGRSMRAQVEQLRAAGALSLDLADQLVATGAEMIATGEALERDGQRMEEMAEQMLTLIGQ